MPLDDVPEAIGRRVRRCALVHERGRAVRQDPVHDVGVTGDPADVGGAPVRVVLLQVEDRMGGGGHVGEVAAGRVEDALGLSRRAAGVEHEERVLGVELGGLADGARVQDQLVPPVVPPVCHLGRLARAAHHDDVLDAVGATQGLVHGRLERVGRAFAVAAVGSDDELRPHVVDAVSQRLGGEPAEHDGVGRADARAGEHRDGELGNHRHVEGDPIALLHTETLEHVREPAHLAVELPVGEHPGVAGLALPDDGSLVAAPGVARPRGDDRGSCGRR